MMMTRPIPKRDGEARRRWLADSAAKWEADKAAWLASRRTAQRRDVEVFDAAAILAAAGFSADEVEALRGRGVSLARVDHYGRRAPFIARPRTDLGMAA